MAGPRKIFDPDYLFDILKLNKWFAIASLLLLAGTGAMIAKDYNREWRVWQRKFRQLELERTNKAIAEARATLQDNEEYKAAKTALDSADAALKAKEIEIFQKQREVTRLRDAKDAIQATLQIQKSELDTQRWELEEALHKDPEGKAIAKMKAAFGKLDATVRKLNSQFERADAAFMAATAQMDQMTKEQSEAQDRLNGLKATVTRLERKEKSIERNFFNDFIRNAPLLDFVAPSEKVREIVTADLTIDYNFARVPRADGCPTCHVAIDVEGYEDQPNPLKTHPRLKEFLSAASPHPIQDFGCTTCHLGAGGGLTFTHAAHTPRSDKQAKEWEEKYGWHRLHHWDQPMLAAQHFEATCYGCHREDVRVTGAPKLNQGIDLVERSGCYGCHKIEGWNDLRKAGPSLRRISSKVTQDWLVKWIEEPRRFNPNTNMPQFFHLSNTSDRESRKRSEAEIWAIAEYLNSKSEPYEPAVVNLDGGDPEKGKQIFSSVGCLACHTIDGVKKVTEVAEDLGAGVRRDFGPDLSQVGSKLSPAWLAAWLKNPKAYWPETRMPDLRLSDDEVRHLVAFLSKQKNPAFDALPLPKKAPRIVPDIIMSYLEGSLSRAEAAKVVRDLSSAERGTYLGEKAISRYGCFGCHEIPGFENANPIGTELTFEASKPVTRFDFGYVHDIDHTVDAWINQKLLEPRIFDKGRLKSHLDKLRMPNFHFTAEEADSIVTFVMGLRKYTVPEHRKPAKTPERLAVRAGRRLTTDRNCQGCHILEGTGGRILAYYEDRTAGPPNLKGEGQKVQSDWLYHFLNNVTPIRPWLNVRMPSFHFDDAQLNLLVKYFLGVENQGLKLEPERDYVVSTDQKKLGRETFEQFQCINCHKKAPYPPGTDFTSLAPSFSLTPDRLRYDWVAEWLKDPQKWLPGTRMPNLFFYDGQPMYPDAEERLKAVRDHLFVTDVYSSK